jgi:hypothetical protein
MRPWYREGVCNPAWRFGTGEDELLRQLREMQHLGEVSKTRQSYRTTADNIFRS